MPRSVGETEAAYAAAGFTLMELLVVLAILAVMTAVIPSALTNLPSLRFRAAAVGLAETLRQAHDDAIRTGQTVDVIVSPERRLYVASGQPETTFPPVVDKVDAAHDGPDTQGGDKHYQFFGDGSATGGTITLSHEQRRQTVTIVWLTGRVQTDD